MKNLFVRIAGLLLLFTSCNSVDSKIIREYKKQTEKMDSCIVNISNIVNFEWDKLYVFKYGAINENNIPESVNNILTNSNGFTRKLIFTLKDSVVYYEEHSIDIEKLKKNEVIFDIPDTAMYKIYPKEKAIFKVSKKEISVPYYHLQQIE